MLKLGKIGLLSKTAEQERAAAFKAEMMALVAQKRNSAQPAPPPAAPAPAAPPPAAPASATPAPAAPAPAPVASRVRDGIQISVTKDGQTTHYEDLSIVPEYVRRQILNRWEPGAG